MGTTREFGSVRKLTSGRYQARYTGPDKQRHTGHTTFTRKGTAQAWLDTEHRLIERGEWTPPKTRTPNTQNTQPTFAQYAETQIKARETRARKPLRPRTAEGYRKLLAGPLATLAHLPLNQITPTTVQQWHSTLPDTPTQNGHAYALLASIMRDAVDQELISRTPCRLRGAGKPEPKRRPEALNAEELAEYLKAAEPHWRPILALTALCSLRSSEVRALRVCDVDLQTGVVRVAQGVTRLDHGAGLGVGARFVFGAPKSSAGARSVAVPGWVLPLLSEVVAGRSGWPNTALLFPAADGYSPLHDGTLFKAHKRAAKKIGRPSLTLHDLRRTGATLAAQAGATTKEVMRRLGHTRPDVAMVYQVADDARDRALAEALPRIL